MKHDHSDINIPTEKEAQRIIDSKVPETAGDMLLVSHFVCWGEKNSHGFLIG